MNNTYDDASRTAWADFEVSLSARVAASENEDISLFVEGAGDLMFLVATSGPADELCVAIIEGTSEDASPFDPFQRSTLESLGWSATTHGWHARAPRELTAWLAALVADSLRLVVGAEHPRFVLGLESETSGDPKARLEFGSPVNADELDRLVDRALAQWWAEPVERDSEGDAVLRRDDRFVWLRSLPESPTVRIFAYVVCDVSSRHRARLEADLLNLRSTFVKFHLVDRVLQATIDVTARPFCAVHIEEMVLRMFEQLDEVVDDTVLRTGGRRFVSGGASSGRNESA